MRPSRRQALALGALGAVGLALPWAVVDEEAVIEAALDALFGPLDGVDRLGALASYRAALPASTRLQIHGLLRAIELAPLPFQGARFTRLDAEGRSEALGRLARSERYPERLLMHGLKQLLAMGHFQHEAAWAAMGYDGPLVDR